MKFDRAGVFARRLFLLSMEGCRVLAVVLTCPDVAEEEWMFVLPRLLLSRGDGKHRERGLREVLQSTPESGSRAGCDGATRRKGSKAQIAVDTRGHPLALAEAGQGRTGAAAAARFRRLAREGEQLDTAHKGRHHVALAILMCARPLNTPPTS